MQIKKRKDENMKISVKERLQQINEELAFTFTESRRRELQKEKDEILEEVAEVSDLLNMCTGEELDQTMTYIAALIRENETGKPDPVAQAFLDFTEGKTNKVEL